LLVELETGKDVLTGRRNRGEEENGRHTYRERAQAALDRPGPRRDPFQSNASNQREGLTSPLY